MKDSSEKVQDWLDAYEDRILLSSSSSTSSTAPTLLIADDDDDHTAVSNDAANVIVKSSSSNSSIGNSDDTQVTVNNIDRILNRAEAMMNQQTVDAAVDAACVRYACDEVVRVLNLSEDVYYVPSSGLVMHIMRGLS